MSAAGAGGLALALAAPAQADPPLWRVEGPHAVVTLISTAPTPASDARWKTPAVQQAAANARALWFINPFGMPGLVTGIRLLATLNSQGSLPDGQHLSALLSPEGRTQLARVAARYGENFDKIDRMKPWRAFVALSLDVQKQSGAMRGLPVERYVIATAPSGVPKHGFDNIEDDLQLLIATPQREQVYELEFLLKRLEDPAVDRAYANAWTAGDLGWIEREREAKLRAAVPVTYQTMQVQPRRRWASQIARLTQGDQPVVVMLDAADFVGVNGLPAMLRAKGLKVDGP